MEIQKAFVKQDDAAVIKCPRCRKAKTLSAIKFRAYATKSLKVKCPCGSFFQVIFEFRRTYRKKAELTGSYVNLSNGSEKFSMIVKNLSLGGIGFLTAKRHEIKPGHLLRVEFVLDNPQGDLISENVSAKWVDNYFVGSEFTNSKEFNKVLGFYLLP